MSVMLHQFECAYLTFWQRESVSQVKSAIHVRVGKSDKEFVFPANQNTLAL